MDSFGPSPPLILMGLVEKWCESKNIKVQLLEIPLNKLFFGSVKTMNKEVLIGNLSTVIKVIIIIIAPSAAIYLGTDSDTAIALLTAIAGALFALVDAKFPNTILSDNNKNG